MSMGTKAELTAEEWDAFCRLSRRCLKWKRRETHRLKRRFWRKRRAAIRSQKRSED